MTLHDPMTAAPTQIGLTVSEFLLLSESGAFDKYTRAELIEGEIWVVNATHTRHARIHATLNAEIFNALRAAGSSLIIYTTPATELSENSLPEPDIAIAEANDAEIVQGSQLRLAVEISDSSLGHDLGRKLRLYASTGVPEYWVVDVEGQIIHQMWSPRADGYLERRAIPFGRSISTAVIADLTIDTSSLL